jgi:hypothetical protein
MRFTRLLLPLLFCLALTSCAGEPAPPVSPLAGHSGNYEAGAVIRLGALRAEAVIAQRAPDWCDVGFTEPSGLVGLAFAFRPEWVTVRYGGLEFPVDAKSLPAGAAAEVMRSALAMAMRRDTVTVQETDSGTELSGTIDAGGFLLSLSHEGEPLKLLMPARELAIEFTDFKFID